VSPAFPQNDDRQRVLDATDIVQLISEHLALKPKGREYVGLCPFHDDHKPSMCVVPHKQMYHCFSCGAGGNAITFVTQYHKMGYGEALKYLAGRANVELTPWKPTRTGGGMSFGGTGVPPVSGASPEDHRSSLLDASTFAQSFFRAIYTHAEHGKVARDLIARRGVSDEMVELFGIGAAPDRWDGLVLMIEKDDLPVHPFVAAGLLKRRESGGDAPGGGGAGGVYDAFRNRLMFPIHDQIGRTIAFGGRRLSDEKRPDGDQDAKYLNSAESPIFDKGATLYGLHQAVGELRRSRQAIVTEGYMDVVACHQAGVRSAVAALGTAFGAGHARLLRRLCDRIVLLFDGDEAGQRAADRALEVFFAEPIDVRIATLSSIDARGAKDPDELLKQPGGVDRFNEMLRVATDALDFRFARLRARHAGLGLSGRARAIDEEFDTLVRLGLPRVDPTRRELILHKLVELTGFTFERVQREVNTRTKAAAARAAARPGGGPSPSHHDAPVDDPDPRRFADTRLRLLACVLHEPGLLASLTPAHRAAIEPSGYPDPASRAVASAAWALWDAGVDPSVSAVLARLDDGAAQQLAARLDRLIEGHDVRRHWVELWDRLRRDAAELAQPESGATQGVGGWDGSISRLARQRELHVQLGDNPRAMPKPGI